MNKRRSSAIDGHDARNKGKPAKPPGDVRQGHYANSFAVGHNAFEFILDFGQKYDDADDHMHTRIVTGPSYARALYETLGMSLQQYEREFGAVQRARDEDSNA